MLGLSPVEELGELVVEHARSASLDLGRTIGHFEINGRIFGSDVRGPLMLRGVGNGRVQLLNAPEPTSTYGTDLLVRYHEEPFHITATYAYIRSNELDPERRLRREVPLTPRHS